MADHDDNEALLVICCKSMSCTPLVTEVLVEEFRLELGWINLCYHGIQTGATVGFNVFKMLTVTTDNCSLYHL